MKLRFSLADAERASDEWGCNCGPAALAAVTGRSLDDIRPLMGDFERKRYTNPTLMLECLKRTGVRFWWNTTTIPVFGLIRVQWEGPWTKPGVPVRVRYRHTHWVAIKNPESASIANPTQPHTNADIFDVNALNSGGWIAYRDWATILVPWLLGECVPKASGNFHFTHFVEVESSAQALSGEIAG
jgi:hypothetical protein